MSSTPHSSFRLSPAALAILGRLARRYGLSKTAVLEWLLREHDRKVRRQR